MPQGTSPTGLCPLFTRFQVFLDALKTLLAAGTLLAQALQPVCSSATQPRCAVSLRVSPFPHHPAAVPGDPAPAADTARKARRPSGSQLSQANTSHPPQTLLLHRRLHPASTPLCRRRQTSSLQPGVQKSFPPAKLSLDIPLPSCCCPNLLFIYLHFLGLLFPMQSLPGTAFIHPTLGASQKPHLCRRLAAGRRKLPAPSCHQDEQGEPLQAELVNPQHHYTQELTAHLVSHSTGSSHSPFCSQLLHALPNLPVPNTFQAHI